ncbi:nuclear transport factor 2 family protein [Actinoplanes sp. NPDC051513]|uniref:nuclear transport factor 2 family protein n=1 Tax=Actinoplanes sp. NPDC051513 TaxID=3363908 RepID=UPI00379F1D34
MPATELSGALDAWKAGIDAHRPDDVAAVFTEDAVFQGLKPYTVGRAGVAAYYDSQPPGMTVDYRVMREKQLGKVVLGWVEADFHFTDGRDPVEVNLTVVLIGGRITHYHVSRRV